MNDSRFSNFLRYLVAIPMLLSYSFVLGSELAALN